MKSQQINISVNIVINYLAYLTSANFIQPVRRLNIQGKKIFEIGEKYYFTDLGLRHTINRYQQALDIDKILENTVNQLKSLGYSITVGQQGSKEIDFICTKGDSTKYIQVAYLINDEKSGGTKIWQFAGY